MMTFEELWRRKLEHNPAEPFLHAEDDEPGFDDLDPTEVDRVLERLEKSLRLPNRDDDTIH